MSDTKTYPTPAADALANEKANLEDRIAGDKETRANRLNRDSLPELREAYRARFGQKAPGSIAKTTIIKMITDADIDGIPGKTQGSPSATRLKHLTRRADEERYILNGVRNHIVEHVDATYRDLLRANVDMQPSPLWMASTAMSWQEERVIAVAWGFIAATIDKGKTPHEAATEAVGYFTGQVIQAARGGDGGRGWVTAALDGRQQSAYAKFIDKLTILDGIVPGA